MAAGLFVMPDFPMPATTMNRDRNVAEKIRQTYATGPFRDTLQLAHILLRLGRVRSADAGAAVAEAARLFLTSAYNVEIDSAHNFEFYAGKLYNRYVTIRAMWNAMCQEDPINIDNAKSKKFMKDERGDDTLETFATTKFDFCDELVMLNDEKNFPLFSRNALEYVLTQAVPKTVQGANLTHMKRMLFVDDEGCEVISPIEPLPRLYTFADYAGAGVVIELEGGKRRSPQPIRARQSKSKCNPKPKRVFLTSRSRKNSRSRSRSRKH